jgi:hypothetical protein
MKKTIAIVALAAAGLVVFGAASGADKTVLAKKQESLSSEYSLAKEPNFYFVLDIIGRKLELRVRGMVLRSWELQAMRFWGRADFAGSVELTRKTALKAPERIVIKPGEEENLVKVPAPEAKPASAGATTAAAADYDLEALELRDMPKRFSLDFNNGLYVTIKTKGGATRGLAGSLGDAWRWYVGLPLRNLFGSRQDKGLSELELTFDNEKDAQSIYWHFFDGIKGIIL